MDILDWLIVAFFILIGAIFAIFIGGLLVAGAILVAGISWQISQAAFGIFF